MATKSNLVANVQVQIWVKCSHCQAQMNEVTDHEAVEPIMKNLKVGLIKSVVRCVKCDKHLGVVIDNL